MSLQSLLLQSLAIIVAVTTHEFIRALVSTLFGDQYPKNKGTLTLNPIKHFEPIGFIFMLLSGYGWGKPVETSPMYYKNKKLATLLTAIFPSVANLMLALIFSYILRYLGAYSNDIVISFIRFVIQFNITLAVYNIIPVPPMDGAKVLGCFLPAKHYFAYMQYEKIMQLVVLLLLLSRLLVRVFEPIISGVYFLIQFLTF